MEFIKEEYFDVPPPIKGSKKKLKNPEAGEGRKRNCTDIKHFKIIALRKNYLMQIYGQPLL